MGVELGLQEPWGVHGQLLQQRLHGDEIAPLEMLRQVEQGPAERRS
jgi:hypothetical protein